MNNPYVEKGFLRTTSDFVSDKNSDFSRHFGIYEAIVEDDYDPLGEGRLTVTIPGISNNQHIPGAGSELTKKAGHFQASPATPSMGSNLHRGASKHGYVSYGIWGPQPRRGDVVLVVFSQNGKQQLYWFACIPRGLLGFMTPGVPNSVMEDGTVLPGLEKDERTFADRFRLPGLKFADNLGKSGLAHDDLRGASTSGKTRESPSMVSGWKSPGLPEKGHVGHQIVMDDRPGYQGIRIRTSNGSQVYISDQTQSIYISTSEGKSWLEMHDDGKIDVYSKKSMSFHTEEDFNLRAGGDFNMDIGGNLSAKIRGNSNLETTDFGLLATNDAVINAQNKMTLKSDSDMSINPLGALDFRTGSEAKFTSDGPIHINALGGNVNIDSSTQVQVEKGLSSIASVPDSLAELELADLPGVPTYDDIQSGSPPANYQYLSGLRVPQHEPWRPGDGVKRIFEPKAVPGHLEGEFSDMTFQESGRISRGSKGGRKSYPAVTGTPPEPLHPAGDWRKDAGSPDPEKIAVRSQTNYIIIHHTAYVPTSTATISTIYNEHVNQQNWTDVGYHYVIERDGSLSVGRPSYAWGSHAVGYNDESVGVALMGGAKPGTNQKIGEINFTSAQFIQLRSIVKQLMQEYPEAVVIGHKTIEPAKPYDPAFDVEAWVKAGMPVLSDYPNVVIPSWTSVDPVISI